MSPYSHFLEQFEKTWCSLFFKDLVQSISDALWSWDFIIGKFLIINSLIFVVALLLTLCFFLSQSWKFVFS
jgi:hypothetical protein